MLIRLFLIVAWVFSMALFSCEKKSDKNIKEYYYRNTSILRSRMEIKKKRYNGLGVEYFRNGKIKSTGQYVQNWRHGKHLFYYETGKLQREENYTHGQLQGVSIGYNESGKKISYGVYVEDKLNGAVFNYFDNGQLFQSFNFKEGQKEGEQRIFYPSGQLKSISYFQKGFPGVGLKEYNEDGTLIAQEATIQTDQTNLIDLNFTYAVKCRILPRKKARFFIDDDQQSSFISSSLFEVPCKNEVCTHTLKIYPGEFVMTALHILALTKSKQGNDLVISKVINVAAGN